MINIDNKKFLNFISYKANHSNYSLVLLKRKKFLKSDVNTFDFVLVKKSKHNKFFVIEKLGSVDYHYNKINLNIFRLIFWCRCNPSVDKKAWNFLKNYIFWV